ncbi:hypothetical protein I4U23_016027 [Adineta vaga]|nr:hypothetical protein I4U23_016027 [Adineta vaga]
MSTKPDLSLEVASYHYCRRLSAPFDDYVQVPLNITNIELKGHQVISFQHLHIVEDYALGQTEGWLVNCSDLWFGPRCQYTFNDDITFYHIVQDRFRMKKRTGDILTITNGKWDCTNGVDERDCYVLEINQCDNSSEFRCSDGLCIPKEMYLDEISDCMDQSDEIINKYTKVNCFAEVLDKECEDYRCFKMDFSCGDGHCININDDDNDDDKVCRSQRDRFYLSQVKLQLAMGNPIFFGHVTLEQRNNNSTMYLCYNTSLCPNLLNITANVTSSRTCVTLISLTKKSTYNNSDEMLIDIQHHMIHSCSLSVFPFSIECNLTNNLFRCRDGRCISTHRLHDGHNDCTHGEDEQSMDVCSLQLPYRFKCDNDRRCISQYLLIDYYRHCDDGSDEIIPKMLFKFPHLEHYRMFLELTPRFDVDFHELCNGIIERMMNSDTDETDCSPDDWPCRRSSTIHDRVWNCPDGRDELSSRKYPRTLSSIHCLEQQYFCLNITNGKSMCLSLSRAGDGHIDCLGSTDERDFCRRAYPNSRVNRYRCFNSNVCISPYQLCDCKQDCEYNDDETLACDWLNQGQEPICSQKFFRCNNKIVDNQPYIRCNGDLNCDNGEDELFCDLIDWLLLEHSTKEDENKQRQLIIHPQPSRNDSDIIAWYCNRGVYVHSSDTLLHGQLKYCFCPPSYYGDRCQFQRKRLSLILQPEIAGIFRDDDLLFHGSSLMFTIIVLFVDNKHGIIVDHNRMNYLVGLYCLPKYEVIFRYPITTNNSNDNLNHSIHIYTFQSEGLTLYGYWKLDNVPFAFLPVNRIAKRLNINRFPLDSQHSIPFLSNINNCTCSNKSICLMDNDGNHVCVCPLGYIGRRCVIPHNPCIKSNGIINNCHGHGQCLLYDERLVWGDSVCVCDVGWTGDGCQVPPNHMNITFDIRIPMPSLSTVFIHMLSFHNTHEPQPYTFLQKVSQDNTGSISKLIFNYSQNNKFIDEIYIQLYEHRNHFDLYLLTKLPKYTTSLVGIELHVNLSNRCRPIRDLFNNSMANAPLLKRVKYFHQPCKERQGTLTCFYDNKLICQCDKNHNAVCFNFETSWSSYGCSEQMCNNRGICVQDQPDCPTRSVCICNACTDGIKCEFDTSGYSLSLDAIIGSNYHHSTIIRTSIGLFSLLITGGCLVNFLAIGTFFQNTVRSTASGLYLLISSLIATNEWLDVCVAIERAFTIIKGTSFSISQSKRIAKWVILAVFILLGCLSSVELVFRRALIDTQDGRVWCVMTLNRDRHTVGHIFYAIYNVLLIVLPLIINLAGAIVIIRGTIRSKQKTKKEKDTRLKVIVKEEIIKHKHILIGPFVLGLLAIPRLVFSFIFVCTKMDRRPFLNLTAYLLSFLPAIANLFRQGSDIRRGCSRGRWLW